MRDIGCLWKGVYCELWWVYCVRNGGIGFK